MGSVHMLRSHYFKFILAIAMLVAIGFHLGKVWQWKDTASEPVTAQNRQSDPVIVSEAAIPEGKATLAFVHEPIESEMVLVFSNDAARIKFLKQLAVSGKSPLSILPALNAVRMRSRDLDGLDTSEAQVQGNFLVSIPDQPDPREQDVTTLSGFGGNALDWLGLPPDVLDWGKGITIAVLDTGIDPLSPAGKRVVATLDLVGADKLNPHGTAVANLLAGGGDGYRAMVPAAMLLDVRVLDATGVGGSFTLAQGIVEAVNRGARVINLSLGSSQNSRVLQAAIEYAAQRGVVMVAAAGNDHLDVLSYPGAYPQVISVGATDAQGVVPSFSNHGESLDVVAPGVGVLTHWDAVSVAPFSGSSASVPFVAGTVAGMLNASMSARQIPAVLRRMADEAGAPGADPMYGHGILNLQRIRESDTPGIRRLGIAPYHMSEIALAQNIAQATLTVQNHGTEVLDQISVHTMVAEKEYIGGIDNLAPGQIYSLRVQVPMPQPGEHVRIQTRANARSSPTATRVSELSVR